MARDKEQPEVGVHPIKGWPFVVALLWLGFVLAISFLEAPLKFGAPSITRAVALEVGYRVFHALNGIEWLCALLLILSLRLERTSKRTRHLILVAVSLIALQTVFLYVFLDPRTQAHIRGETVEDAPWHIIYIVGEMLKVILLATLAYHQVADFGRTRKS